MDEHEHYLMNKLSNLLRLSHTQLIDGKLKVLQREKGKKSQRPGAQPEMVGRARIQGGRRIQIRHLPSKYRTGFRLRMGAVYMSAVAETGRQSLYRPLSELSTAM